MTYNIWEVNGDGTIYYWNGAAGWTQVSGSLVSIAVASDGQVWGTNEHHLIYQWNGTSWTQIPGNLDSITAGASMVWGLSGGKIYRQAMAGWAQIPASIGLSVASIAVAAPSAPPPAVLGSNTNYILYSDCKPVGHHRRHAGHIPQRGCRLRRPTKRIFGAKRELLLPAVLHRGRRGQESA